MQECPKCHKAGYLYQEKPRDYKNKRKYTYTWQKEREYRTSRIRHGYWFFVHNIRIMKGKWKTRRCYLGLKKEPFRKI